MDQNSMLPEDSLLIDPASNPFEDRICVAGMKGRITIVKCYLNSEARREQMMSAAKNAKDTHGVSIIKKSFCVSGVICG